MLLRGKFQRVRQAAFGGAFYIREQRGQLVVCRWPTKRGRPKSATTRDQNEKFAEANLLAQYAATSQQTLSRDSIQGTPLQPRDFLISAMYGRLFAIDFEDGFTRYSMTARLDASRALDILAQLEGSVLVRSGDLWIPAANGSLGRVLTHQGASATPAWQAPQSEVGSWQQIAHITLAAPLAIGAAISVAIPLNWQTVEALFLNIAGGSSITPVIRINGDSGAKYWRIRSRSLGVGSVIATFANAQPQWNLFSTLDTPMSRDMRAKIQINMTNADRWFMFNGEHVAGNSVQGTFGGYYSNTSSAPFSTIELLSIASNGLNAGVQFIVRAVLNPPP